MRPRPLARLPGVLLHPLLPRFLRLSPRPDLVRVGSGYGGWTIPRSLVSEDTICYSGGTGEDVTFDLGLIRRFGCEVFAFDPTPRAIKYAQTLVAEESRFHFFPFGLWSEQAELRFYAPKDPAHVSHSAMNLQGTSDFFVAPVRPLSTVVEQLGHERIDLLKLDIEGAEYAVLNEMLDGPIRPVTIAVEFDQPVPILRMLRTCRRLRDAGYELVHIDDWDLTFVRQG